MKKHTKIIFFDNNILSMTNYQAIFEEVISLNKTVDFNQGLDARLLNDESAELISKMKIPRVRLAYDNNSQRESVPEAINLLSKHGVPKRDVLIYTMFNFTESPEEFFERVKEIFEWGGVCYPMRFQPVNTLKKDSYIAPAWTKEKLNMVAAARRVIGFGGAFPPYAGLVKKFKKAKNFQEAFELYPK